MPTPAEFNEAASMFNHAAASLFRAVYEVHRMWFSDAPVTGGRLAGSLDAIIDEMFLEVLDMRLVLETVEGECRSRAVIAGEAADQWAAYHDAFDAYERDWQPGAGIEPPEPPDTPAWVTL